MHEKNLRSNAISWSSFSKLKTPQSPHAEVYQLRIGQQDRILQSSMSIFLAIWWLCEVSATISVTDTPFTQFCSALFLSHSKPHCQLTPEGVGKAKGRKQPWLLASHSMSLQLDIGSLPSWDHWTSWASLYPFPGLFHAIPTWPDCNLSADLWKDKSKKHMLK